MSADEINKTTNVINTYNLPDGTTYDIPESDWNIAERICSTWEQIRSNEIEKYEDPTLAPHLPSTLPIYAKISRSIVDDNNKNIVKITIPLEKNSHNVTEIYEFEISIEDKLTHSFEIGPTSREQSTIPKLYALQHLEYLPAENDRFALKKYIHHKAHVDKNNSPVVHEKKPIIISRVKWAISKDSEACLYKTELWGYHKIIRVDIGITLAEPLITIYTKLNQKLGNPNSKNTYLKVTNFMFYLGPDLDKYFTQNNGLTPEQIFSKIKQCHQLVRDLNEGKNGNKCYIRDIKPQNFTILDNKIYTIDTGAIIAIENITPTSPVTYTHEYSAPEVKKAKGHNYSVAADIYSLGQMFKYFASKFPSKSLLKRNLIHLGEMMSADVPTERISHEMITYALNLLEVLGETVNFTNIWKNATLMPLFYFQFEARKFLKNLNMIDNATIMTHDKRRPFAFLILSVIDYFSKEIPDNDNARKIETINNIFTIINEDNKENSASPSFFDITKKLLESFRESFLNLDEKIKKEEKEYSDYLSNQPDNKIDFCTQYLLKQKKLEENIQFIGRVLFISMDYLKNTSYINRMGRTAINTLKDHLLNIISHGSAENLSEEIKTKISQEIQDCINGKNKYGYGYFSSPSSPHSPNSRARRFKPLLASLAASCENNIPRISDQSSSSNEFQESPSSITLHMPPRPIKVH